MTVPVSIRTNNPGAMWLGETARLYGAATKIDFRDGNNAAVFPDPVAGAAAQFALWAKSYSGMTLEAAIAKWSGNNSSDSYAALLAKSAGIRRDTPITRELLMGPHGLLLIKAQAKWEAGQDYPLTENQWRTAQRKVFVPAAADPRVPSPSPAVPSPSAMSRLADIIAALIRAIAGLFSGRSAPQRTSPFPQPSPPKGAEGVTPTWAAKAVSYIGVHRAADHHAQQIMAWAAELGGDIAHDYTSDQVAWCALFANAVLYETGHKGTGTLWALDFAKWGKPLMGPCMGAFAPMQRDGGGHIAIVIGRDQHGNLMCVGGNQSSAVSIEPFPLTRPVAFRWPAEEPLPARIGFDTLPIIGSDGEVSTVEL
jgi:uncharacterized protein (TIGR02594 family)